MIIKFGKLLAKRNKMESTYPGDSKLEFISGYEKKPLYTNLDVGYPVTKLPCTAKRSFLSIMAILIVILVIALTAALSRSSCRCFQDGAGGSPSGGSAESLLDEDSPFPWDGFRLPSTITPTRYHVTIVPAWHGASPQGRVSTFKGEVEIYMNVLEQADSIMLNAKDLRIKHYSLHQLTHDGSLGQAIPIAKIQYDNDKLEMLHFALPPSRKLLPGQSLVLNLTFSGSVSKSLNGLYASSYVDSKGIKRYLLSTQFEPNYARRVFPCFDEPAFKATFEINLVRPGNLKALSNMPLMVSVYAPPEQIDQANFALKVAVDALNFYEDFFAIKFPLPKMDLIAIPDFSVGAMENWGLVTYRMVDLLYKPNVTSESAKQRVAIVVTHELAHQWFGNLVTMAWWNDLWLNEGFASYMEYVCTNEIFPSWHMLEQFSSDTAPTAFALDALASSHPVSHDIQDPNSIQAMFDSISYNKGALILRMLDGPVMPHTSFKKGLHAYLTKYAFKNAKSQDLWRALQDAWNEDRVAASKPLTLSRIDLEPFMSGWINQKGFPLITSTDPQASTSGGASSTAEPLINLYQSKFVSQHHKMDARGGSGKGERRSLEFVNFQDEDSFYPREKRAQDPSQYVWQIPFTLALGTRSQNDNDVRNETVWMKNGNSSIEIGSMDRDQVWLKGNLQYAGYYLVNYGPKIWANLRSRLASRPDSMTALDKCQLIDNAFFLDRFGYTKAVDTLKFYTYVNPALTPSKYVAPSSLGLEEKEPIPLMAMLSSLSAARYRFHSDDEAYDKLWPAFINKLLLKDLLKIYDWRKDLPHLESFLQSSVINLAVSLGNEEAITKAKPIFKEMIYEHNNERNYLPYPDLTSAILTAGIRYGTTEDWETAWKAYQVSNVPSEKVEILNALGTSRDPNLLSKLLQYTLNPDLIRTQDMYIVISRVASNVMGGSRLTWDFVRAQWPLIEERFGDSSSSLGNILKSVGKTFDNPTQAQEFESFVASHSSRLPALAVNQTRETIELNVAWLASNGESVKAWLKEHL